MYDCFKQPLVPALRHHLPVAMAANRRHLRSLAFELGPEQEELTAAVEECVRQHNAALGAALAPLQARLAENAQLQLEVFGRRPAAHPPETTGARLYHRNAVLIVVNDASTQTDPDPNAAASAGADATMSDAV